MTGISEKATEVSRDVNFTCVIFRKDVAVILSSASFAIVGCIRKLKTEAGWWVKMSSV